MLPSDINNVRVIHFSFPINGQEITASIFPHIVICSDIAVHIPITNPGMLTREICEEFYASLGLHQKRMWSKTISLHFGGLWFPGSKSAQDRKESETTQRVLLSWLVLLAPSAWPARIPQGASGAASYKCLPRDQLGKCVSTVLSLTLVKGGSYEKVSSRNRWALGYDTRKASWQGVWL